MQEAKRQLAGTVAQFRAVMDQKKALREELTAADEARKRMRDEAKALRDRLPYVKVWTPALILMVPVWSRRLRRFKCSCCCSKEIADERSLESSCWSSC